MELANSELEERVRAVRRFNRFYTRKIGVLTRIPRMIPYFAAQWS